MEKLDIISLTNFVRGGKSSIARLLAEKLGTNILNFDPKRDSEYYNAIKTTNIPENSKIKKTSDSLIIDTEDAEMTIKSKSNYLICDFGGRFDERIKDFESDIYIIPMMDDFESITESIKATKYILKYRPDAKIIHVLNMVQCFDKEEKEFFRLGYKKNIDSNNLQNIKSIEMPRSKLLKKMVNDGKKGKDIFGDNIYLEQTGYRNITNFITNLINTVKEELNENRN
jgi:hypothetical protein